MKRVFFVLSLISCFLLVSCSSLFDELIKESGSISVTLPGRNFKSRAAEDVQFAEGEFRLVLSSGDEEVSSKKATAGETISFDGLEPGTYSIYGIALSSGAYYEGSEKEIEVVSGKTTAVSLVLKILDYWNPKMLSFTYEGEYNRYLAILNTKWLQKPFSKNSIVKATVSGVPTEDFNGEIRYYYGAWNDKNSSFVHLSPEMYYPVKNDRKKGQRFEDTFIMPITDIPDEDSNQQLCAWYSVDDMNKPMNVTELDFKFEYIDSVLPDFVNVKSTSRGLEITVKRRDGILNWSSVEILPVNSKLSTFYSTPDSETEVTMIWPFVSNGEALIFKVQETTESGWTEAYGAFVYKGVDTRKRINETLLGKFEKSGLSMGADYNINFQSGISASDYSNIINFASTSLSMSGNIYAENLYETWIDGFAVHDEDRFDSFMAGNLNLLSSGILYSYSGDPNGFINRLSSFSSYAVELRVQLFSEEYPMQMFVLPALSVENCPVTVPPAEKVVTLESGSYIISEPISEEVEAGDYVLVKFSGDFCYEGDSEFETEIRGILYIDDTDICTMDDVWIEETITQNKTVNFSYGFYVRGAFPGDAIIEIVVSRTGGDTPPDYITIKNYQCEIEVQKEVDGKVTLVMPGATAELPLLLDFISTMELDEPGAASSYVVTISGNADSNIAGNLTCAMVVGVPRTGGAVNQKVVTLSPNAIDLSPGDITRELFFDFTNMDDGIAGPCDSYLTLTFDLDAAKSGGKISDFSITITKQ